MIHHLVRRVPDPLALIHPLVTDHLGVQRVQHYAGQCLGAHVLALMGYTGALCLLEVG